MKRSTRIITLSAVAAVALAGIAVAAGGPGGAWAHGGWGKHQGRGAQALCSDLREERLDKATAFVEAFVAFTPEQSGSWNALKAALAAGSDRIGAACESAGPEIPATNAPDRLAQIELALATGHAVVQDIRPAFEDLYGKLSDEQRAKIDDLISKRRHGRRH